MTIFNYPCFILHDCHCTLIAQYVWSCIYVPSQSLTLSYMHKHLLFYSPETPFRYVTTSKWSFMTDMLVWKWQCVILVMRNSVASHLHATQTHLVSPQINFAWTWFLAFFPFDTSWSCFFLHHTTWYWSYDHGDWSFLSLQLPCWHYTPLQTLFFSINATSKLVKCHILDLHFDVCQWLQDYPTNIKCTCIEKEGWMIQTRSGTRLGSNSGCADLGLFLVDRCSCVIHPWSCR